MAPRNGVKPIILPVLTKAWHRLAARIGKRPGMVFPAHQPSSKKLSNDLDRLMDLLIVVRRRVLANSILRTWLQWGDWILIGLMVIAAIRTKWAGSIIAAAVLLTTAAFGICAREWRNRMSPYESACLLDTAAGLKDRLSTSIWFGETAHPEGLILYQRRDALKYLSNLDVRTLIPIRIATLARRTLLLSLLACGLFIYRVYRPAPLTAILKATWHSQLLQSGLSPRRLPVTSAVQQPQESTDSEMQALDQRQSSTATDTSADAWGNSDQDKPRLAGQQPPDASGFHSLDSTNGNRSLAQSLMQTLKDIASGRPEENASSDASANPPLQRQDSTQPKNASQNATDNTSSQTGAESARNSQQNGAHHVAGAGGQRLPPKAPVESSPFVVTPVVERVPLEAKNFKGQKRMPVEPETGSAELASGNAASQRTATMNGAEKEDIPERYRSYVQRYFEHQKGQ